jgi:hypothetical protein
MNRSLRSLGALGLATLIGLGIGGSWTNPDSTGAAPDQLIGSNTYGTGLNIVNQSSSADAHITIVAYKDGAAVPMSGFPSGFTATISPNQIASFFSGTTDDQCNVTDSLFKLLPANSLVSFVVSADQPIAASVNTQRVACPNSPTQLGSPQNPIRVGTSSGVSDIQTSQTVYAPQVFKNFGAGAITYNSRVYVQCASSSDCNNTAWALFTRDDGTQVANFTMNIKAFSSFEFDPNGSQTSSLGNGFYSLKVVSADPSQKLALATNFFGNGDDATSSQFQSYNGAGAGDTKLYAPRLARHYTNLDLSSGLRVQNIGTVDTKVTITYQFNGVAAVSRDYIAKAGQSVGPFLGYAPGQEPNDNANGAPQGLPNSGNGAATIVSTGLNGNPAQPIIGTVNENSSSTGVNPGLGDTYSMFPDNSTTTKAVIPQVLSKVTTGDLKGLNNGNVGYTSGVSFQNVGTATTNCTVTFSGKALSSSVATNSFSLDPGQGKVVFLNDGTKFPSGTNPFPAGFNGAAVVDCGTQKVVAVVDFSARDKGSDSPSGAGDSFTLNNGLNQ